MDTYPNSPAPTKAAWLALLQDQAELLRHPATHHKALIQEAHALHRAGSIDRYELSDFLEQADGALAYAVEALLDEPCGE
ncbi:hypothetical protein SAMN05216247_104102 [Pseudomonas salomonii]|uniref:Uncharacterized protein n=1 Tax=Pseudomonas salomonii TaxID=191391 RepID=A0A1H3KJN1_9PSED|nr:hypothetical protein SAMN05216247_104102 [Pseudomonas salomonii]